MKRLIVSTSSPRVAVAVLAGADVVAHGSAHAPRHAEAALFEVMRKVFDEAAISLDDVHAFIADVGPGSFTGVRVGVTVAKTLAWTKDAKVAGIPSFDLIAEGPVAVPSRRDMYLLRESQSSPPKEVPAEEVARAGASGYGPSFPSPLFPDPRRAALALDRLTWIEPEELLPWYVLEPGISTPKTPYPRVSE